MNCPNCKIPCEGKIIDQVAYRHCPDCGWFVKNDDNTWTSCNEPEQEPEEKKPQEQPRDRVTDSQASQEKLSPAESAIANDDDSDSDDDNDDSDNDDDDGIDIEVTFEDE